MNTPIHDFLLEYARIHTVRCHMPGGKGLNSPIDITEIDGADSLYESSGIIRESEANAARLFGAGATLYSCSGSTLAIQTMLAAVQPLTGKRRIAAGRYCHKSVVCSCGLLGLDINWIYPDRFLGTDISPEAVEAAIDADTGACGQRARSIPRFHGRSPDTARRGHDRRQRAQDPPRAHGCGVSAPKKSRTPRALQAAYAAFRDFQPVLPDYGQP